MIARRQDENARRNDDERRTKAIDRILVGRRKENELLQLQGAAREALQKWQEVLGTLAEAEADTTSAEYEETLLLFDVYEQLAIAEE